MPKRKENYAWVKANTENMSMNFEGPIQGCAIELFVSGIPRNQHRAYLEKLTKRIEALEERANG